MAGGKNPGGAARKARRNRGGSDLALLRFCLVCLWERTISRWWAALILINVANSSFEGERGDASCLYIDG
jgi:hypothetical protein